MINLRLKINKNLSKWLVAAAVFGGIILGGIYIYSKPAALEVDFLDIGQGDAALIKLPTGQLVIIDGGPDNLVLRRLGESLAFCQRRIDYVILSHYHEDHITGLIEILRRYKVRHLVYSVSTPTSPTLDTLLETARESRTELIALSNQAAVSYGPGCAMRLLNPDILGIKADNNNSLVVKITCAGRRFLFTGDNSTAVEKALANSGWDLEADVLKAAHHGSNSANSELFLAAVHPDVLVISVGAGNKFGHPSPRVLERATARGIEIRRIDQAGTLRILAGNSP
ncbi:MAG: MBL fold metallo-hydrolase [Patescibacteria group bacterium]